MRETVNSRSVSVLGHKLSVVLAWLRRECAMSRRDPMAPAIERVEKIGTLPEGYNGHGAAVAPQDVRDDAINFLRELVRRYGEAIAAPTLVAPASDAGVIFEWRTSDTKRALEVVFLRNKTYEWTERDLPKMSRLSGDETSSREDLFGRFKDVVYGHSVVPKLL